VRILKLFLEKFQAISILGMIKYVHMLLKSYVPYYKLFENSPLATAVLDAENFKIDMVNQKLLDIWQRSSSISGLPLLEVLPEMIGQRYPDYLRKVCRSGEIHAEQSARVMLNRSGQSECVYMDYSYTPISGEHNKTIAVLVMATDVCERELNRLIVKQSARDLRALVLSASVPMCIYRGPEFKIEAVNNHMLDIWQGTEKLCLAALGYVFHHGAPYTYQDGDFKFNCTPLGLGIKGVEGVCVIATRVI
jgi:hypothetical protein